MSNKSEIKTSFPDVFEALQDAILNNESVKIKYKKGSYGLGAESNRKITPKRFSLIERKTSRYHRLCVSAYCHLRETDRVFAIYRIKELSK